MIHSQLNYLTAQQHAEELRRVADRDRLAQSFVADRRAGTPKRQIARLRLVFAARG